MERPVGDEVGDDGGDNDALDGVSGGVSTEGDRERLAMLNPFFFFFSFSDSPLFLLSFLLLAHPPLGLGVG